MTKFEKCQNFGVPISETGYPGGRLSGRGQGRLKGGGVPLHAMPGAGYTQIF